MSLHDFDVRDTLPDSDASTWSDYWDCHRWELGLEPGPSDVDRLGQAAETLERAAAFLDGLSPIAGGAPAEPSPADLIDRLGCCLWCRTEGDAEPSCRHDGEPARPHHYTPSEFARVAAIVARPHLD